MGILFHSGMGIEGEKCEEVELLKCEREREGGSEDGAAVMTAWDAQA